MFEKSEMARRRGQRKGHLRKQGDHWYLTYRVDSRLLDFSTGKAKRERITVQIGDAKGPNRIDKREAQRIAWDEYLSRLDQVSIRPGSAMTVLEFVNRRWRPDVLEHLKPSGKLFYETQLRNHVLPFIGQKSLRDVSLAHVQDIVNQRSKTHSPRSVECICITIQGIFKRARQLDYYSGPMPTDGIRRPQVTEIPAKALSWSQVEELAAILPEPCATLILFLTVTGLRIGEACGLRWEHVNLTDKPQAMGNETLEPLTVAVRENWVMGRRQTPKSLKSRREVPIPPWMAVRLASFLADATSRGNLQEHAVFANGRGSAPIDHHNLIKRVLKPAANTLGLGWIGWHSFRRSNASIAERLGLTVAQRQMILGHTDPRVTMRYSAKDLAGAREMLATITPTAIQ